MKTRLHFLFIYLFFCGNCSRFAVKILGRLMKMQKQIEDLQHGVQASSSKINGIEGAVR